MARVSMGYPGEAAEIDMLDTPRRRRPRSTSSSRHRRGRRSRKLVDIVRKHPRLADAVKQYASTWPPRPAIPELRLGASPRATLHLVRAAKARAALQDRDYVLPDDVKQLAVPVLAHRLLPTAEAQIGRRDATEIVAARSSARVPVPRAASGRRTGGGAR